MDQAARPDRFFRRLFGGKVSPVAGAARIDSLFLPHDAARGGAAVVPRRHRAFLDTWMAGGLGRAQSGYDEMVFRCDGARRRALLRSAGPGVGGHEDRLPAADQLVPVRHAVHDLARAHAIRPEKVVEWVARRDGQPRLLCVAVPARVRHDDRTRVGRWIADERAFQQKNLDAVRQYPLTPHQDLTKRALGSVSRAYYDPAARTVLRRIQLSGRRRARRRNRIRIRAPSIGSSTIKGPTVYTVTSLALRPGQRARSSTRPTTAPGVTCCALDPRTRRTRLLQKDARIGDLAFNRADDRSGGFDS